MEDERLSLPKSLEQYALHYQELIACFNCGTYKLITTMVRSEDPRASEYYFCSPQCETEHLEFEDEADHLSTLIDYYKDISEADQL